MSDSLADFVTDPLGLWLCWMIVIDRTKLYVAEIQYEEELGTRGVVEVNLAGVEIGGVGQANESSRSMPPLSKGNALCYEGSDRRSGSVIETDQADESDCSMPPFLRGNGLSYEGSDWRSRSVVGREAWLIRATGVCRHFFAEMGCATMGAIGGRGRWRRGVARVLENLQFGTR